MIELFHGRNTLPMIYQSEINECGVACLAMVANYYGKKIDIRTLRGLLRIPAAGASVKHLLVASSIVELQGRPLKLDLNELGKISLPVILHWDMDHFVVLKKVSRRSVVIHDPAVGIRKYFKPELGIHFTGIAVELYPLCSFKKDKPASTYSLKQLFRPTPGFYRSVRQVFLLSLLIQLLALLSPLYLQLVIDQGLAKGDMDLIYLVAVLFLLVVIAKTAVSYFRGDLLLRFSNQLGFQLMGSTFGHLLGLPLAFFEKREMGDIVSRFSSLETIKQLLTQEMVSALVDGIFSLITLILLYIYNPVLATIGAGFVALFALLRFISIPMEKSRRQELLVSEAKQKSKFMENIRSVAVTKVYAIEGERLTEWRGLYASFINTAYHLGHFQLGVASLQSLLFGIDHIVTIYLGSGLVYSGGLTVGQLMSFIFLKQHFANSILAMLPKLAELRLMKLELERVSEITLEEKEEHLTETSLLQRSVKGKLEIQGVGFSYSDLESPIFENLSFAADVGSCLVITGRSACGKSTLLKLILGLETPTTGSVLLDGIALKDFGMGSYRSQIAAILHSDVLLSGTLAYNIHLETDSCNEDRMEKACQRAGIYEEICALAMGLNTRVGEMGVSLSAGQVQRILLARALYRLPRILIMDEAMSHLGDDMARDLVGNIKQLGITVITVTHNPVLLALATHRVHLVKNKSPVITASPEAPNISCP